MKMEKIKPLSTDGIPLEQKDTAWSCVILALACCTQVIIYGNVYCFGIYFVTLLEYFRSARRDVALIASMFYGTNCMCGAVSGALYRKLGCRMVIMMGGIISATGCFLSYFATGLPYLTISYGVITGFGLGLAFTPTVGIQGDYFHRYRYLASSFVSLGAAAGSLLFQPIFLLLIREYGWQGSMLINAGICLHMTLFGSLLKSRTFVPDLKFSDLIEVTLWKKRTFLIHSFVLFLWGGATLIVFSMINGLVMAQGISKTRSAMIGATIGLSNLVGRFMSAMIAQWPKTNRPLYYATTLGIMSLGTLAAIYCKTFLTFALAAAVFGLFFGQMMAHLSPMMIDLFGAHRLVNTVGYSEMACGVGGLVFAFIAGVLADNFGYKAAFYLSFAAGSFGSFLSFINLYLWKTKRRTPLTEENGDLKAKMLLPEES